MKESPIFCLSDLKSLKIPFYHLIFKTFLFYKKENSNNLKHYIVSKKERTHY